MRGEDENRKEAPAQKKSRTYDHENEMHEQDEKRRRIGGESSSSSSASSAQLPQSEQVVDLTGGRASGRYVATSDPYQSMGDDEAEEDSKRRRINELNSDYTLGELIEEALCQLEAAEKYSVAEVYSPPRVVEEAIRRGLKGFWSLDLTVSDPFDGKPWDFNDLEKRRRAKLLVERDQPTLLIGSPMCTAFSVLQNLSKHINAERKKQELRRAVMHMKFCCELYKMQVCSG
eukprot:4935681-Karenia_brevis.AAC.1